MQTEVASEFRYNDPFVDNKTLLIAVSQSGETADTLAAIKEGKRRGCRILAITNVVGSSVSREADDLFYTWAGPEISVASTKAYTSQLVAFYSIALHFSRLKDTVSLSLYKDIIIAISNLSSSIEEIFNQQNLIKEIASSIKDTKSIFYLGRGVDYTTALEGALKLKEISYIHTEAFAAGELKHGTIALIEDGTPVIVLVTQSHLQDKMLSNIKEVKARGAYVIALSKESNTQIQDVADIVVNLPLVSDLLMPIISVIPTQLLAYYTALMKGNNVDRPRNLAKSVTVE